MEKEEVFDEVLESRGDCQNDTVEEEVVGEESGEMVIEEDVANSSSEKKPTESTEDNYDEDFDLQEPISIQNEDQLQKTSDVGKEEVVEIHAEDSEPIVDPIIIEDNPPPSDRGKGNMSKGNSGGKNNKGKSKDFLQLNSKKSSTTPTSAPPTTKSTGKKTAMQMAEHVEADRRKRFEAAVEQERLFHENKMREIELQLQAVRSQLDELSPPKPKKKEVLKLPKIKVDKYSEAALHHPKLELIMAQNAYSPYLVPPDKKYTQKTFQSGYVSELRFEKKSVAKKKLPYDLAKAKRRFIEDILKFKVDYKPAGALRRSKPGKNSKSKQVRRGTSSDEFPLSGPPLVVELPIDQSNSLSSLFEGAGNFMSLDLTDQQAEEDYLSEFAPIPDSKPEDGLKLPFERDNKQYYDDDYNDDQFDQEDGTKENIRDVQDGGAVYNNNVDNLSLATSP